MSPVCGSASPSLVLGWAPGFMELTWWWGRLGPGPMIADIALGLAGSLD